MNPLLSRFGYLRLLALFITSLPLVLLPLLGLIWLWQNQHLLFWLLALLACGALGYALHWLDSRRLPEALTQATGPSPEWPAGSVGAWQRVEALAEEVDASQWSLDDTGHLVELGRQALEEVARHYHPERSKPLLELTLPHALLIIERASRDLRLAISEQVPFSHQLTLGSVIRVRRWSRRVNRLEGVYRTGRALFDPMGSVFREASRAAGQQILGYGSLRLRRWLLQEYVRKVGFYGVELYSGHMLLDEASSEADEAMDESPVKILVLGRNNAGKTSLIQGLFGDRMRPEDGIEDDRKSGFKTHSLRGEALDAWVMDSPGLDAVSEKKLHKAVLDADLILWVTAATRADRQAERETLERIRHWLDTESARRRPAPLVVAVSRIDQLPPVRQWQPPYDLNQPDDAKARHIVAAIEAIAADFDLPTEDLVPVCLADSRLYNLEDGLWAAILDRYDEVERARLLRLLPERQRAQARNMTWRQLRNAGRFLIGRVSKG